MPPPERFCLNHVQTPAAANCVQCHKPLCEACIVEYSGKPFCSAECVAKYRLFKASYKGGPIKSGTFMGKVVGLIILVAVVGAVLFAGRMFGIGICDSVLRFLGL